jgi:hypothetical protein
MLEGDGGLEADYRVASLPIFSSVLTRATSAEL